MPPFNIRPRAVRPSGALLRAGFASRTSRPPRVCPSGPQGTLRRPTPPIAQSLRASSSHNPQPQPRPGEAQEKKTSSVDAISSALHSANHDQNNLLSPVRIPEDLDGVLNEGHPATSILANSAIVVTRQLELMNVMMGFEQANKYVIMDPQGQHIGFMAERDLGMGNMFKRQMFNTHRSFTTHVFDRFGKEVLRVRGNIQSLVESAS